MPMFSVIIPTYNRAAMLREAIDSVLRQRFTDYEVIVVDDGSTDETLAMLNEFGDQVKVLSQANAGPSAARNLGITEASGEYIAFLDSDDLWMPWTLANYAAAIEQFDQPAGLLGSKRDFRETYDLKGLTESPAKFLFWPDMLATSERDMWRATPVSVIRRELLTNGPTFRKQTECFEDLDLWLRLGTAKGIVQVLEPPALAYRQHDGAVTLRAGKSRSGVIAILAAERRGDYPGGKTRAMDRRRLIGRLARAISVGLVRRRWLELSMELYGRSFWLQLRLGRVPYLLGFPFVWMKTMLRGGGKVGSA